MTVPLRLTFRSGGVESGGGFLVLPGVSGKRISIHVDARPVVSAARPDARAALPGDRGHGAGEIDLAGDAGDVVVVVRIQWNMSYQ